MSSATSSRPSFPSSGHMSKEPRLAGIHPPQITRHCALLHATALRRKSLRHQWCFSGIWPSHCCANAALQNHLPRSQLLQVRFVEEGGRVVCLSRSSCDETMALISNITGVPAVDDVALWVSADIASEEDCAKVGHAPPAGRCRHAAAIEPQPNNAACRSPLPSKPSGAAAFTCSSTTPLSLCSRALKCACDATPRAPFSFFVTPRPRRLRPPRTGTAAPGNASAVCRRDLSSRRC